MANWKTTLTAFVSAFFGFVVFKPQYFSPVMVDVAAYIFAGGLAFFGIVSADAIRRANLPKPQDPPIT